MNTAIDTRPATTGGAAPAPVLATVCQVAQRFGNPSCTHRESGGYLCERIDPHTDGHAFGQHTIQHARMGNGWACTAINPPMPNPITPVSPDALAALITRPDVITAVARAEYETWESNTGFAWDRAGVSFQELYRDSARAALAALLTIASEEAATA